MPLTVISSINIGYEAEYVRGMLVLAGFSLAYLSFTALVSSKLSAAFTPEEEKRRAQRYAMIFGNTIFLGYPIANALFGAVGMLYASIYIAA